MMGLSWATLVPYVIAINSMELINLIDYDLDKMQSEDLRYVMKVMCFNQFTVSVAW